MTDTALTHQRETALVNPASRRRLLEPSRGRLADANCAKGADPLLSVKRFPLRSLLSSGGCGIDHSEPHRLRFNVAILITGGKDDHMVDFAPLELKPRDFLLLRAGQVHAFGKERSVEGEILAFTSEFVGMLSHIPQLADMVECLLETGSRVTLANDSACMVHRWYDDFSGELSRRGAPLAESRILLAFALLIHRLAGLDEFAPSLMENPTPRPKLTRDFEALLGRHFLIQREPAWYAGQLHVSTRTLDRRLVKAFNQTCKELIRARLLLEAKRLLVDPDLQIKDVAYALHFEEVANFSRFFHQNAGLTPSEFRSRRPGWPH